MTLIVALSLVMIMNPSVLSEYWNEQQYSTVMNVARADNASPIQYVFHLGGIPSVTVLILFLAFHLWHAHRCHEADRVWSLLSVSSVLFLPIAWVYSVVPLTFALIYLWNHRQRLLALVCIAIAGVFPPFGGISNLMPMILCFLILIGLTVDVPAPWIRPHGLMKHFTHGPKIPN